MVRIVLQTLIEAPPERVFDLATDVSLHERGSKANREKAVAGVTQGLVEMGSSVTWRAKHFGVWHQLSVVVTEFDRPRMFADEMTRGPYRSMRHVHRFDPDAEGTLMTDDFQFEAPFGLLGRLAEWLFLERYMRSFLVNRNRFLKEQAERIEVT